MGAVMKTVSRCFFQHAHVLAKEVEARAVVVYADAIGGNQELRQLLATIDFPTILITRAKATLAGFDSCTWASVPDVHMTRTGQIKVALLVCLARDVLQRSDRVVCLSGIDGSSAIDTLMVLNLGTESELFVASDAVTLGGDVAPEVFERTLGLAAELAVEGREGRPIGAIFVLGDSDSVLAQSKNLVLNPFFGHPESDRNILDTRIEETIKEFSAIDGAFIVRGDGLILTSGAQLIATRQGWGLPKGLGTRHAAAAAITASTRAVAISISESTGTVTVFKAGQIFTQIHKPSHGSRCAA